MKQRRTWILLAIGSVCLPALWATNSSCGATVYNAEANNSVTNPNGLAGTGGCEAVNLNFTNFFDFVGPSDRPSPSSYGLTFPGSSPTTGVQLVTTPTGGTVTVSNGASYTVEPVFSLNVDQSNPGFLPPAGDLWNLSTLSLDVSGASVTGNTPGAEVNIQLQFCMGSSSPFGCSTANSGSISFFLVANSSGPPTQIEEWSLGNVIGTGLSVDLSSTFDKPANTTIGFTYVYQVNSASGDTVTLGPLDINFEQQAVPEPSTFVMLLAAAAALALRARK